MQTLLNEFCPAWTHEVLMHLPRTSTIKTSRGPKNNKICILQSNSSGNQGWSPTVAKKWKELDTKNWSALWRNSSSATQDSTGVHFAAAGRLWKVSGLMVRCIKTIIWLDLEPHWNVYGAWQPSYIASYSSLSSSSSSQQPWLQDAVWILADAKAQEQILPLH